MEFSAEEHSDPSGQGLMRPFDETIWLAQGFHPPQDVNHHISFERSPPTILSIDGSLFQPPTSALSNRIPSSKAHRIIEEGLVHGNNQVQVMWKDSALEEYTWESAEYLRPNISSTAFENPLAGFKDNNRNFSKAAAVASVPPGTRFIPPSSVSSPGLDSTSSTSSTSSASECCLGTDCAKKCGGDCEDACDDDCSQQCADDCRDDCEDCQSCMSCEPCVDSQCPERPDCMSPHGIICYKTDCYEAEKYMASAQCAIASPLNPGSYMQSVEPNLLTLTPPYSLQYPYGTPSTGSLASFADDTRVAKRRKPNLPTQISLSPDLAISQTFPHNHSNFFCHWGPSCDAGFADYFALDAHVLQAHIRPQIDFTCHWEACGEAEKDLDTLLSHVRQSHAYQENSNERVCLWEGCNSAFGNSDDLSQHLSTNHLNPPIGDIMCEWESCGAHAYGFQALTTHLHTDHLKITSTGPGIEASPKEGLICQWLEVGANKVCGKTFSLPESLQNHLKDAHIAKMQKKTGYLCRWANCGRRDKAFSQKGKVERHMQTHTGFKSCRCEYCHKEFSAPQALQQHIRTHTGEKPYKCDICGKEFAQGSAMTMHKRVHTGERPLRCDFPGCGKRFSESSNLSKHRKTHNPIGQHKCDFEGCERSFHRIDQLKRHQKTHGILTTLTNSNPS